MPFATHFIQTNTGLKAFKEYKSKRHITNFNKFVSNVLTRQGSASAWWRRQRGWGVKGVVGGIERHGVWRRWREGEGVRRPSKVQTLQDTLTHLLHLSNLFGLWTTGRRRTELYLLHTSHCGVMIMFKNIHG